MIEEKMSSVISIKQEEAIEEILNQTLNQPGDCELDIEISTILLESERHIESEYESMAKNRFMKNRMVINLTANADYLESLYSQADQTESQISGEEANERHFSIQQEGPSLKSNPQPLIEPVLAVQSEHILLKFEREHIRRCKQQQEEIIELDEKYPKINSMSMYKHQYPIFNFSQSSTTKYLRYKKVLMSQITAAVVIVLISSQTIHVSNQQKWTLMAIGEQILVFTSESWKEPKVIKPQRQKEITLIAVSPSKNYIAVGLINEILVYQIKNEASSLVLIKNFSDLKVTKLSKLIFYHENPIRICYVDNEESVGLLYIEQIVLFTKVTAKDVLHIMGSVEDADILTKEEKGGYINSLLKNSCTYVAMVNKSSLCVYKIEPSIELLHFESLQQQTAKDVRVRWRYHANLQKPQLFVSCNDKIYIYKLIELESSMGMSSSPHLQLHLLYQNHYDITGMEIISDTHLLLYSHQNIIVVAIPLISSSPVEQAQNREQFEAALIYVYSEKDCRILYASYDEILYYSSQEESLQIARLKTLSEYLDELMIQHGKFREAFILLVLVYKGVNFSYKFSYKMHDLTNSIFAAIQCAISSLIPQMDTNIAEYRIGWICQLLIETKNQPMIWNVVYKKLKERNKKGGSAKETPLDRMLFDTLELFVLRNQIRNVPEEAFFSFIEYECEKQRDNVLEKIIMNNVDVYDGSRLSAILHSRQRYYLQFYLFSQAIISDEKDYYTPFVKVFSSFKQLGDRNEEARQIRIAGLICLWYLSKCFSFQQIPQGIMTLESKNSIVLGLLVQILQPTFTRRLAQFNLNAFFQVYLLIFANCEMNVLIEEFNDALIQKYQQFYPDIWEDYLRSRQIGSVSRENSKFQIDEQSGNDYISFQSVALSHIRKTVPCLISKPQLLAEFQALALYYSRCQMLFENIIDILIILFENKFNQYSLQLPYKTAFPTVEQLELRLIGYIEPVLLGRRDRFYLNKLISFNDPHVSYMLYRLDHNYKQSLEHFITTKTADKILPYIHELLNDISTKSHEKLLREKQLNEIKQFLIKNIGLLFKINGDDALNIFFEIGETTQSIYLLIEQSMGDKLNFLSAVLDKFSSEDFEIKEKFLLEHLAEVCLLQDHEMLHYLNKYYYPLDLGIVVCEKKGNLLAKAILEERSGKISDAFMSYERLVKNIIQSNSRYTERKVREDVQKYTEECIRLCKQFSGEKTQENFWLRMINFVNGFIKSTHQQKVFLKVEFERMLQYILNKMFEFLPTTLLIDFFVSKTNKLELSLTKQFSIFENLFVLIRFDIGLATKVIDICKVDVKDGRNQSLNERKKGLVSNGICDFCKNPLQEEQKSNIFSCEHSFHTFCHEDKYRCLTCYYESDDSIVSSNVFGSHLKKSSIDLVHSESAKTAKKSKTTNGDIIYVENAFVAQQQSLRKKMKIFDYQQQKQDEKMYEAVNKYQQDSSSQE